MSTGTCTMHIWNDGVEEDKADPKVGIRVNERLEHEENLYSAPRQISQSRGRARPFVGGGRSSDW